MEFLGHGLTNRWEVFKSRTIGEGGRIPHLHLSAPLNSFVLPPLHNRVPDIVPMAFPDDITNFYANSYPTEGFDFDPFTNVPPIPQQTGSQMPDTLATHWGLERPEFVVGSSAAPHIPVSYGKRCGHPRVDWYLTRDF